MKAKYDTTLARIAGNLLSSLPLTSEFQAVEYRAKQAVAQARAIVAEIITTEPSEHEAVRPSAPNDSAGQHRDLSVIAAVDQWHLSGLPQRPQTEAIMLSPGSRTVFDDDGNVIAEYEVVMK